MFRSSQESSASAGSTRSFVSAEDTLSEPRDILESPDLPSPISYEYVVDPSRQQLKSYDHDAANSGNINEAPDYAFVIFEYMRTRELSFVIKPNYLSASQPDVTPDMRAIVVDWMVEVSAGVVHCSHISFDAACVLHDYSKVVSATIKLSQAN